MKVRADREIRTYLAASDESTRDCSPSLRSPSSPEDPRTGMLERDVEMRKTCLRPLAE